MIKIITESFVSCFNERKTGISFYDDLLNPREVDYMKFCKGIVGRLEKMTASEYIRRCAEEVFGCSVEKAGKVDKPQNVEKYAQMMKDGVKFNLPYLNLHPFHGPSQEGRHRMLAMAKAFGEDAEGYVLVCEPSDPSEEEIREYAEKRWGSQHIDFGVRQVKGYLDHYVGYYKDHPAEDEEPEDSYGIYYGIDINEGDVIDYGDGWARVDSYSMLSHGMIVQVTILSSGKDEEYYIGDDSEVKYRK